ncbi:MAG: hypothetical protein R2862_07240 [Thermoanaerobaculia bacterium]
MNRRATRHLWILVSALTLTAVSSVRAEEYRLDRSFPLAPGATVELRSEVGAVVVRGGEGSSAELSIRYPQGDFTELYSLTVDDRRPDHLEILVERKSRGLFDWIASAWRGGGRLELVLPRSAVATIRSSGGRLELSGLDGAVRAGSSGGALRAADLGGSATLSSSGGGVVVERIRGDVEIESSGGSVKVREISGTASLQSSGGSVEAEEIGGRLDSSSSGGGVRIREAHGAVFAESSGGPVTVGFAAGNHRGGRLNSSGGGVHVTLDPSVGLAIDAVASGGSVRCDLPVTVRGQLRRERLQGELNGGGANLELRSSGGGITIGQN